MLEISETKTLQIKEKDDIYRIRKLTGEYSIKAGLNNLDKTKLIAAVSELANNSLQHSINPVITIELLKTDDNACVSLIFKDNGPGIKNINLLLDDNTPTENYQNFKPIGILTAKRLVDEFSINSSQETGTTIKIIKWKIRQNKPKSIKISEIPETKIIKDSEYSRKINNIFIIDDEEHICKSLSRMLRLNSYVTKTFLSSEAALHYLENKPEILPELVITDYKLKGQSGLILLEKIKEKFPDTSVILMTGYGDKKLAVESLRFGADDFLDKPLNPDDVLLAIDKLINKRSVNFDLQKKKRAAILNELDVKLEKVEQLENELNNLRTESQLNEKETQVTIKRLNKELAETNHGTLVLFKELDEKNEELLKKNVDIANHLLEKQRLEKIKNEIISVVAHELKNPLTSITGSLNIITSKMRDKIPDDVLELVSLSYSSSKRLHGLINNLLDIEKIESENFEMNYEENNISLIITDAIYDLKTIIDEKHIDIVYNSCNNIVICDNNSVFRIVVNLLSNAIKFSENNGKIIITETQQASDIDATNISENSELKDIKYIKIGIQDFGRGIPESFKEKIFKKFQQVEREDATVKGGSGLGLTIVKLLVEKQRGKIWFDSKFNEGTTFYFTLPYAPH